MDNAYIYCQLAADAAKGDGPTWVQIAKSGVKVPGTDLTTGPELYAHWKKTWEDMGRPELPVTMIHPGQRARPLALGGKGETLDPAAFRSIGGWLDVRFDSEQFEALVDWNEEGRTRVRAREFRGQSLEMAPKLINSLGQYKNALVGVTLTNTPYIVGMRPAEAEAQPGRKERHMPELIETIRTKLGIESEDESALLSALDQMVEASSKMETIELEAKKKEDEAKKAKGENLDLLARLVVLEGKVSERDALDFYDEQVKAGKATEATKATCLEMARKDIEFARRHYANQPPIVALDDVRGAPSKGKPADPAARRPGDGKGRRVLTTDDLIEDASDIAHERALALQAKNPDLTYTVALSQVVSEDPQLEADMFANFGLEVEGN